MSKNVRRTYMVDWKVQFAILLRTLAHWTVFLAVGFGLTFCWEFLKAGPATPLADVWQQSWQRYSPAIITMMALLPVAMYDWLRFSHRFTGPMFRFRTALNYLAKGESPQHVRLRKGDFWHDVADSFNTVIDRLQQEEHPLPANSVPGTADGQTPSETLVGTRA